MENNKSSLLKHSMTYGAIIGGALIVYSLLMYFMNLHLNKVVGYLSYIVLIIGLYFSAKNYRDQELGGNISYGQGLGYGVLVSFFCSIILAFYLFLFYKIIDPDTIGKIVQMAEDNMVEKGYTSEQISQGIVYVKKFTTPTTIALFTILGIVFYGFIFSLIISAIVKKQTDAFDGAMHNIE